MEAVEWVFSGIGTSILVGIVSFVIGGITGYRIGIHNKIHQKQNAGHNTKQCQIGQITNNGNK